MISEPYNTILIVIGIGTVVFIVLTLVSLFMLISVYIMNKMENIAKPPKLPAPKLYRKQFTFKVK